MTKAGPQKELAPKEFAQLAWNAAVEQDLRQLVRLAVCEDLGRGYDWTTVCLVPEAARAAANFVVRQSGVICGLAGAAAILDEMDCSADWHSHVSDGTAVEPQTVVARIEGSARDLLTAERTLLNFITPLSGIATLTAKYVTAVQGTRARIYDTRKTLPGWRSLQKYAVRCGGGHNHRLGLHRSMMIKDNHLAFGSTAAAETQRFTLEQAVARAHDFAPELRAADPHFLIEVEVDRLDQLPTVLTARPDIVLLDNMSPEELAQAVALRDAQAPAVSLEASGGVSLDTVAAIARSGVDRISVGALTHSAPALDVGLDWDLRSP